MPDELPLGRPVDWPTAYDPALLAPIPRGGPGRDARGRPRGFHGFDLWHAWELSWLDMQGKPRVAVARLAVPCDSPAMVESKSLKLYLGSLNQHPFADAAAVVRCLQDDLGRCAGAPVAVELLAPPDWARLQPAAPSGRCLDTLDIGPVEHYRPAPELLRLEPGESAAQCFHSHLLRSLCPVTGQPDWATLQIDCAGPKLAPAALLRYIVSYRLHQGFHEHCVESIFDDLMTRCRPRSLTVSAWYLRRGGLDINPVRSTVRVFPDDLPRLVRQ